MGAFIVHAVVLGLAASSLECFVDIFDRCREALLGPVFDWAKEDVVTVIVVGYEEVVVASTGGDGEASCLISVDDAFGFGSG